MLDQLMVNSLNVIRLIGKIRLWKTARNEGMLKMKENVCARGMMVGGGQPELTEGVLVYVKLQG